MPDPKKNVIVICEDEPEIYNAYLTIMRKLGLKTPHAPTDPSTVADAKFVDGKVFMFKNYDDAEQGLAALAKRPDARVTLMIMDQVLDPGAKSYISHTGKFGTALIERHAKGLEKDQTYVLLRTAEEGDVVHAQIEECAGYEFFFQYILKRMDPDYSKLINTMIPSISRSTGIALDDLRQRAEHIDLSSGTSRSTP